MKLIASLLLAATLLAPALAAPDASAPVKTDQVTARLLAHAPEGVAPGKPLMLGLQIDHAPHWHTYWKNPGDSGLPTQLAWTLPAGFEAGAIKWPTPSKLAVGPLVNYGFEGPLLLPVAVKLPAVLPPGPVKVQLAANWLVCKELCIPESGEFTLELPQGQAISGQAAAFEQSRQQQPQALQAAVSARVDGDALLLRVQGLPSAWQGQAVSYFAGDAGVIDHAQPEQASWDGATLQLKVALSPQRSESPDPVSALLRVGDEAGELRFAVQGGWPATTEVATPALQTAPPPAEPLPAAAGTGFLLSLLLAFAGGLLLNLMPCVFPVLSLKALALVNEAPHERHVGAAAYTAGVVLSFLALAGLLLLLRDAGSQIGWGFQLQEPLVVGALALLFTLIALNLFGVFEFGNWAPSSLAGWRAQRPWVDQFATGVLGVAIASPCTAPFMGAALGAALTLPAWQGLAVFAALGLGLAAPYALVALWPPLARLLPRPGAWMARLRTLLAFPMLATVLWLVWVLGVQRGLEASIAMLVLLLALAFAVWAWAQRGMAWRVSALLALAGGAWWSAPLLLTDVPAPATATPQAAGWQAWSPEAQARLLAEGKPVFVDFTAAWCISCQYNKRTALADAAVLQDFAARGVVLMRADWTLRDAVITAELRRLGRSGVPVYALHVPGAAAPVLLPEILSAAGVRETLASTLSKPS